MRADRRVTTAIACLVPLAISLLLPALFWDQGCIEREALTFVRQYLSDRSIPQKIFDPHANDLGTYQARELSYAIDLIDAHAYPHLASLFGAGFSIPLSALLTSGALVIVVAVGVSLVVPLPALTLSLLLVCFVSSFSFVSTMGLFYRSAKPVLALMILAWAFHLLSVIMRVSKRLHASGERVVTFDSIIAFVLALVVGLLDRQGVFFVATGCVILAIHYRLTRGCRELLISTTAALVALQLYNFLLAPLIIQVVNGYWPTFAYQAIPVREVASMHKHVLKAIALLILNTAAVLGGPLVGSALGVVAVFAVGRAVKRSRLRGWVDVKAYLSQATQGRMVAYGVLLLGSQVLMFALMIARHGYVYRWVDHRYWYYPLPYLALVLMAAIVIIHHRLPRLSAYRRTALNATLLLIAMGNAASLNSYREVMIGGPWFQPVYAQCEGLKSSLRDRVPVNALDPEYRNFFNYSQLLIGSRR